MMTAVVNSRVFFAVCRFGWVVMVLLSLPDFVVSLNTVSVRSKEMISIRNHLVSLRMSDAEEEARKLRQKADELRKEIKMFETKKEDVIRAETEAQQEEKAAKLQVRMRYSAEVPILKENGQTFVERVDFPPRFAKVTSRILTCEASLPLGIILGEDEDIQGAIRVDEVAEGGNGGVSGVKEGDLLRACTACQATMERPTWQLLAGGVGQPKTKRFMYSVDNRPFAEVMDAVGSNRMDPEQRLVILVLERRGG